MDTEQVARALARTEIFADIDDASLKGLAAAATVQERKAGERLFEVGDPGDELYVVVEGSVRFSVTSKRGEEVLLSELHAPEAFGELALVQGGVRSARADVGHDAVLITVSRARLLDVLSREPAAVEALLRAVGGMVRRLTKQFADREQKLTAQVAQLRVEIDQARRERDVARLTENDDFIELRDRAAAMRAARQRVRPPVPVTKA